MTFSFLSWNIKKFKATPARTQKVVSLIKKYNPDIFGISEFSDKKVARKLASENFKDYDFGITESKREMEILVAYKRTKFDQVIFTQRREFLANNPNLRPGALVSVKQKNHSSFDNILFLHTDSGTEEKDHKSRQIMFKKIWSLNNSLKNIPIQKGKSRLVVGGDLNTMGNKDRDITASQEITKLHNDAQNKGMVLLDKSHSHTWRNTRSMKGNLDHVIVSDDLNIQQWFFQSDPATSFPIIVDGWVDLPDNAKQKDFVRNISDHSLLYGEVL